jgi:hypothetical protein
MTLPEPALADLAAVLYRRKFIEEKGVTTLTPDCLQACVGSIQQLVVPERSLTGLKKLGDVLVGLYDVMRADQQLLTSINTWMASPAVTIREFAMYCFELASELANMMAMLRTNGTQSSEILVKGLSDPELNVRVSAVKSTACFLTGFEEEEDVMAQASVMPTLLTVLTDALNHITTQDGTGDVEDKVKSTFTSLSELTQHFPRLWINVLD